MELNHEWLPVVHTSTLGAGCPKRRAPSCVASRQWLPIRQIIVEIEIGIGIDPVLFCTWPSEHRSNFTAELCQHRNNTVSHVRIPSHGHSIPIAIAIPPPSLLRHCPFLTDSGEECLATEVTEKTEASHLKHPDCLVDDKGINLSVNSVPSVAKSGPKRRAPSCVASRQWLPIRQIIVEIEIVSVLEPVSESIPFCFAPGPLSTAQTSLPICVSTATIRFLMSESPTTSIRYRYR